MTNTELNEFFARRVVIFDGAMGTELYRRHVFTNRCYDELCLSDPKLVAEIHTEYLRAGAEVLTTNSYGANRLALKKFAFSEQCVRINERSATLAREVIAAVAPNRPVLLAGSLGPLDVRLPLESDWEALLEVLREQAQALLAGGVDFLLFETLPDYESALLARLTVQRLGGDIPFLLSHNIPDSPDLAEIVKHRLRLEERDLPRPFALGLNCGLGPDRMLDALEVARTLTNLPLVVQPNAGAPRAIDNRQLYLCSPEYLSTYAVRYVTLGARGVGGCCGTSPEHIANLAQAVKPLGKQQPLPALTVKEKSATRLPEVALEERSALGRKIAAGEWITAVEMSPPRGWDTARLIANAKLCREHGVDVVNIPDGPRAAPRLSALATAVLIQNQAGLETVLHVCCRDRNYIGLQADLLGCAALGLRNLLFITGDPPKLGNYSFASAVFDTDSIGLVNLQKHLNQGLDLGGQSINPPTAAVIGVGADPNAIDFQREIDRLRRKVDAGAQLVTTQPVFDIAALQRFLEAVADLSLPVIAGIWPLVSLRNALFMKNEVPGVIVPDRLIARIEAVESAEDQLATGIAIASEAMQEIRNLVAGVQVSAPLGNVRAALAVLGKTGLR